MCVSNLLGCDIQREESVAVPGRLLRLKEPAAVTVHRTDPWELVDQYKGDSLVPLGDSCPPEADTLRFKDDGVA